MGYTCEVSSTNFNRTYQLLTSSTGLRGLASWHPNVVRIHLNEDCWLGINGVAVGGPAYQQDVVAYVNQLNAAGFYVVLDPLMTAPGPIMATAQNAMADEDHTPAFWRSVATVFKANHLVVFDLFNEPYLNTQIHPASAAWSCWLEGGCTLTTVAEYTGSGNTTVPFIWQTAGMQQLVDAVRATGAIQPLMLSGLQWAYDLSQWLDYLPHDPLNQLVADFHLYTHYSCGSYTPCYQAFVPQIAQSHPVVTGEFGDYTCDPTFMSEYMSWADQYRVSYIAFGWQVAVNGCQDPYLLSTWSGTPSAYGQPVHDHLLLRPSGA